MVADPLRSWWTGVPPDVTVTEAERTVFEQRYALDFAREVSVFVPLVSLANLLCWPFDAVIFAGVPGAVDAYTSGRLALLALGAVVVLLLQWRPAWSPWIATVGGAATCVICAATVSALGAPSSPWFGCLYTFLLGPIFWYIRPPARVLATLLAMASLLLGYLGPRPEFVHDPAAPGLAVWLLFIAAVCFGVGLRTDRLRLRLHCAQRDLAAERAALAERVREQTDELRQYARRLDQVQDAERAHVARELHDELGQTLTAARLSVRLARQRFERAPAVIGPNLEQAAALLDTLTTQTRSLVHDLRPPVLDDLGLVAAVEWLATRTERAGGPACTVEATPADPKLPPELAVTAFRCVQEALTNVLRHASATAVRVQVRADAGRVEVQVHDNGVGADASRTPGVGLVGMRERAEMVGGSFRFESRPGAGCSVHLSLPVPS